MDTVDELIEEVHSDRLARMLDLCAREVPGFSVKFKDQSALMRGLNFFAQLFNPVFMTRYTTTVGTTVYFPSKADLLLFEEMYASVLAHELVHMVERKERGVVYNLSYVFPQVLAVGAALSVLSVWNLWFLLSLLFLLALAPIPSPGRRDIEYNGYEMSLAVTYWRRGSFADEDFEWVASQFVSSNYYFMWPFKDDVMHELKMRAQGIRTGEILKRPLFRKVHDIIKLK